MKAASVVGDMTSYIAEEDGKTFTGTVQDMTPYAERSKRRHNEGHHGTAELKHAAEIPMAAVETYMNVHGIDFEEFMTNPAHIRRMLQDPDLADFRIWKGRVS